MMTLGQMQHARRMWALSRLPNISRVTLDMLTGMNRSQRRAWFSKKRRALRAVARSEAIAEAIAAGA